MKSFRSARPAASERAPDRNIRLYQSETAEILEGPDPIQLRITVLALAGLFVSLLVVAMVMKIDRVVGSVAGEVVTVEPTIVLGGLDQSLIRSIDVTEGQRVAKGQLLATFDPTFTGSDVAALKAQVANLDAQIARAHAELAQQPYDPPPAAADKYSALQRQYYLQRKAQVDAQLKSYDEQIAQAKATMAKYQNDAARYGDRSQISREVEQMRATLAADQVGSRLNLLAATDQKIEILRNLEFDRNAIAESQHQLDSVAATRAAYMQQWYGQTSQDLVTAQGQHDTAVEQLAKATKHDDQVRLEAPADGMVLRIAKVSVHSVLSQGEPLIYLAPLSSPVEAELHISPQEIGFIRTGDPVVVKFDAFSYVEHGTASGIVRSISEGVFTTDDRGQSADPTGAQAPAPYYKVRVTLTDTTLRNVPPGFRLVPGMSLSGDIHVGRRSLFMYLMHGLMRGFDEAMREP